MSPRQPHRTEPDGDTRSDLLRRVVALEEVEVARNHLHSYAAALDQPVPEQLSDLWTADGTLAVPSGDFVGRSEIAQFYRSRTAIDPSTKRHFIMNVRTRHLDPGLVEIASYFVFTSRADHRSALGWGRYLDRIRVEGGVARFEHKTIIPDVNTDLAQGWAAPPAGSDGAAP